jgi:hypothetical protein
LVRCCGALLGAASIAQEPIPDAAGCGAIYSDLRLDPWTGNALQLGCAVDPGTGWSYVSAARQGGSGSHWLYVFDAAGALQWQFAQPAVHDPSPFGMRDLECDGQSLLGGSEFGISVVSFTGGLAQFLQAANGPQPIQQPIAGPILTLLPVVRALALDPHGNGGNGSLLVADFGTPIYEIDFAGNVLQTFPYQGWSAYGLTIDPTTGNPWVFAGPNGQIEELDRQTMVPTGRALPPAAEGAPGGLALASPVALHHAAWPLRTGFVHLVQGQQDHLAVQRLHLFPNLPGWDEIRLEVGCNGGPLQSGVQPFWRGDTLQLRPVDPTGLRQGLPVWLVFNVYQDANRNAATDLSSLWPGTGILWEHRSLQALSVPSTSAFLLTTALVGSTTTWTLPAGFPLADRNLFRMQGLYFEPNSPQGGIASTNSAVWQAQAGERGIVVAAEGPNSFHGAQGQAFWSVRSDTTHGHGAILRVEFDTVGATGFAAGMKFDIDQNAMDDRFDGGNRGVVGFRGTYRNGSAALCGLDFQAPGVYVAPFHGPGESCGAAFALPPDASGNVLDLQFAFTAFTPGKRFEFDCDTDYGPPAGNDHAGMVVRVTTANSGVLVGRLQVDAAAPFRSVVWFP